MAASSRAWWLSIIVLTPISAASAQYGGYGGGGESQGSSGDYNGADSGSDAGGFDFASLPIFRKIDRISIAHAVLASLAWVILFPLGSILLRTISWKMHSAIQMFALVIFTAGFGMGIWLARRAQDYMAVWKDPHVIIGLIVFALATIQPVIGYIHHILFIRRSNGRRTGIGLVHVWIGRALIFLGIINGGLGLRLAGNTPIQSRNVTRKAEIGYGVVSAIMFLLYAVHSLRTEMKRAARPTKGMAREMRNQASSSDDTLTEGGLRVYRTEDGPMVRKF